MHASFFFAQEESKSRACSSFGCMLLLALTWSFHCTSATVQNATSVSYPGCIDRIGLQTSSRADFAVKEGCSSSPEGLFPEA